MSETLRKKTEKILDVLDRLALESAKEVPIIVEGRADVEALRRLGVKGAIVTAKGRGKSLLTFLEEIERLEKGEVILLMDFDRRGKEWTGRLTQRLEKMRIKPNTHFWSDLFNLARKDLKDIEGLATYIETLKRKLGNKI